MVMMPLKPDMKNMFKNSKFGSKMKMKSKYEMTKSAVLEEQKKDHLSKQKKYLYSRKYVSPEKLA